MNRYSLNDIFIIISISLILSGCTPYNTTEIPSQYIGIFENYNGKSNGTLSQKIIPYSGVWIREDELLTGKYEDGIPTGVWISNYPNKIPQFLVTYYDNGNFLALSFYPNGMPQSMRSGKYCFAENEYSQSIYSELYWGFDGNIIDMASPRRSDVFCAAGPLPEWVQGLRSSLQGYSVECYYMTDGESDFTLSIYLIPREKLAAPECIQIKGTLELNSKKLVINEYKTSGNILFEMDNYLVTDDLLKITFSAKQFPAGRNNIEIELWLNKDTE